MSDRRTLDWPVVATRRKPAINKSELRGRARLTSLEHAKKGGAAVTGIYRASWQENNKQACNYLDEAKVRPEKPHPPRQALLFSATPSPLGEAQQIVSGAFAAWHMVQETKTRVRWPMLCPWSPRGGEGERGEDGENSVAPKAHGRLQLGQRVKAKRGWGTRALQMPEKSSRTNKKRQVPTNGKKARCPQQQKEMGAALADLIMMRARPCTSLMRPKPVARLLCASAAWSPGPPRAPCRCSTLPPALSRRPRNRWATPWPWRRGSSSRR